MARQQVEFEFPDPDKTAEGVDIEVPVVEKDEPLEIEGAVGRENVKKVVETPEVEIEVKDDTPPKDRNRKKSDPPEEVTDDELAEYSDKVKKRIQHFSKGYHDERRAKEQALREREELERYARQLVDENQKLKVTTDRSHNTLIEQAKQQVQLEVSAAQKRFKEAYEAGDADALVAAQEALTTANIRASQVAGLKPKPLQATTNTVQHAQQAAPPAPPKRDVDAKAESWRAENTWFGSDDEMTAYALGYHSKLVKEGVDPRSDEYYEKVNSRMRKMFPESFDDIEEEPEAPKPKKASTPNVVAPATRSTGPRKVTLTATQVSIAKRLGVPLEQYAKQVAELQRK
jgi:hypothetical protein